MLKCFIVLKCSHHYNLAIFGDDQTDLAPFKKLANFKVFYSIKVIEFIHWVNFFPAKVTVFPIGRLWWSLSSFNIDAIHGFCQSCRQHTHSQQHDIPLDDE